VLAGTTACTDVLVIDDTACTKHFGFPLVVIIGADEHGRNQGVAFVILFDRCTERFEDFLKWPKPPRAPFPPRHWSKRFIARSIWGEYRLVVRDEVDDREAMLGVDQVQD
jgi:hypothetical protein